MKVAKKKLKKIRALAMIGTAAILLCACDNPIVSGIKDSVEATAVPKIEVERESEEERLVREEKEAVEKKESTIQAAVEMAEKLALTYDYEGAIAKLDEVPAEFAKEAAIIEAKAKYEAEAVTMLPYEGEIPHIFFHSLIVDTDLAFDGDHMEEGYNYWMTTLSEFNAMMEEMYKKGYVLINIHEIMNETTDENGNIVFEKNKPLVPEGKIPFILSIDDVNYYEYMETDGFAKRLVIDENGEVKNFYIDKEGNELIGDYDVMPALDTFVKAHPDFSLRGAKGIIAETGYEGALGYDTHILDSPTYEEDAAMVRKIAELLKADGWEFAVHGYGHRHTYKIEYSLLVNDTEKWKREVGSLVGDTDIYIYPYGEEVDYPSEKLSYLQGQGYKYFCGVGVQAFLQVKPDYVRQGRRNLDGFTMTKRPEMLLDMFEVDKVWDINRPPIILK